MHVLVTGGAGYVGSHTCAALLAAGHEVTILDSFRNAARDVPRRLEQLSGRAIRVVEADVRDREALATAFAGARYDALLHFAALKSVAESVADPIAYWDVNVTGSIRLFEAALHAGIGMVLFSSSALVYDAAATPPMAETAAVSPSNPYGQTKLAVERLLGALGAGRPWLRALNLRYFNPVGAHPSGLIGEAPSGTPANLFPVAVEVAAGRRAFLEVFGNDYPTRDGTAVRDYLHVMDVAEGHVAALGFLAGGGDLPPGHAVNLGSGTGSTVLEIRAAFEAALGRPLPSRTAARRAGDVPVLIADTTLAESLFGWQSHRSIEQACRDAIRWAGLT
jgi:UDP-glucose 4-epimerase